MDYYGTYPLKPGLLRGYKPSLPNAQYCAPPCKQLTPLNPPLKLGYWELLSPALLGTVGALFLSLFSDSNHLIERCDGTIFKLTLIGYAVGATIAVSFAVTDVLGNSKARDDLLYPIQVAIISIILLFAAEYLLLYRFFPSSFKGDVGDNFWTQLFSFLYFSVTSIATADLGDILPANLTARALIAIEIAFNLFTIATAIQLVLAQKN